MLARLYHRVGMGQKAIEVLEAHTNKHPEAIDLTEINILAELYMEGEHFDRAAALIRSAEQQLCAESGLPIDLKASTSCVHYNKTREDIHLLKNLQRTDIRGHVRTWQHPTPFSSLS